MESSLQASQLVTSGFSERDLFSKSWGERERETHSHRDNTGKKEWREGGKEGVRKEGREEKKEGWKEGKLGNEWVTSRCVV